MPLIPPGLKRVFSFRLHISRRGFTLIELMVVIAMVAILARVVVIQVGNTLRKSRDSRRISDFKNISGALLDYRLDHQQYPPEFNGNMYLFSFEPNFLSHLVPNYFRANPRDPINSAPTVFDWFKKDSYYYAYYYYADTTLHGLLYGCGERTFAILGVRKFESTSTPTTQNAYCGPPKPFNCPPWGIPNVCRDWGLEFDRSVFLDD